MRHIYQDWALLLVILFLALSTPSKASGKSKGKIKSAVFLSPKVELAPGISSNKNYHDLKFPKGHIAIKNFYGELVDDEGNSIPLYETYLHHWTVIKYYQPKNSTDPQDKVISRNAGICQQNLLSQYFGLGSETRQTATRIPDPFGIEVGNPTEIPAGYEEKWMVNLHVIDTQDRIGCTECRCDLYNVTKDGNGQPLRPGYIGG
ncbi:hypothetical protein L6164_037389 [Bauhinia variegata]|uniref:Uncharacterized protein n=1 Tax=Bauhinia variegata TaxID=167791 RepID=A0ACB9KK53_BAUVA|nr:hypothetical protein L6164_037389 [Bauhinia variegata]